MDRPLIQVDGARTGRSWQYDLTLDSLDVSGERYGAKATDDGSIACVHRCEKDSYLEDELARMRLALTLAVLPEIAAASTILRLLDLSETPTVSGEFGHHGSLYAVWEWAELALHEYLDDPNDDRESVADQVQQNVGAALEVLHGLDLVHTDVAPNNVPRVDGVWKLADLDSCTPRGMFAIRAPLKERYVHPDRHDGPVAARDFDHYGLEQVVARVRR